MAKFCSLSSSSSGNCTYIGSSQGGILIDAGISAKRIAQGLSDISVDPASVHAIFVTHEHTDHICGIRVFAKKYGIKVYASQGTLEQMNCMDALDPAIEADVIPFSGTEETGFFVRPFRTMHDSRESTGYSVITPDGKRISVATDMGKITDDVMNALYGNDLILLESNHDKGMLQNGPYPFYLKKRILSDYGHLSNDSCAEAAVKLAQAGTTRFVLGHLSKENNMPALALATTRAAMSVAGIVEGRDYLLSVAGTSYPLIAF